MEIPFWLRFVYGFVETFVAVWFVCVFANIKITIPLLSGITLVRLLSTLFIRSIENVTLEIIVTSSICLSILYIWFFTRTINLKTIFGTFIVYFIVIITESVAMMVGFKQFHLLGNKFGWLLTGLPHILVVLGLILLLRRVRSTHEKMDGATP